MVKRLGAIFKSNKGNDLVLFFIVFPILFILFLNIVIYGAFQLRKIEMSTIVNEYNDKACLEGQLSTAAKSSLFDELEDQGFDTDKIKLIASPAEVNDDNDATYVPRYNDVSFGIIYEKPHAYYYVSKFFFWGAEEENYYIGDKYTGMSEKW